MNQNEEHNLEGEPNFFSGKGKDKPFDLPDGYFDSFENKLKAKLALEKEFENELSEFPMLKSIQKTSSFTVPNHYFNIQQEELENQLEKQQYQKLYSIHLPEFKDLDAEYVKVFNQSLNYKIELADELKAFQTLYHIDKINPFAVHDSYFESLASNIKERIYARSKNENSLLQSVLDFIFGKKVVLSFSALIVVTLSVYFYQSKNSITETGNCQTLACLERQEILNNKAISNFDEEQLIDMVDVNSLDKQLNSNTKNTNKSSKETTEDSLLEDVNVDDLTEAL